MTQNKQTLDGSEHQLPLCPVELASQIIGQKWTLQIVHNLMQHEPQRFCELQEALGGVNPSTLSSRLKMLEEGGMVRRREVSATPPHVEYSLTDMGEELHDVIHAVIRWSNTWLCPVTPADEIDGPPVDRYPVPHLPEQI